LQKAPYLHAKKNVARCLEMITKQGWFSWECLQYTRTSCFNCSHWCYKRVCLVHNCILLPHSR